MLGRVNSVFKELPIFTAFCPIVRNRRTAGPSLMVPDWFCILEGDTIVAFEMKLGGKPVNSWLQKILGDLF